MLTAPDAGCVGAMVDSLEALDGDAQAVNTRRDAIGRARHQLAATTGRRTKSRVMGLILAELWLRINHYPSRRMALVVAPSIGMKAENIGSQTVPHRAEYAVSRSGHRGTIRFTRCVTTVRSATRGSCRTVGLLLELRRCVSIR